MAELVAGKLTREGLEVLGTFNERRSQYSPALIDLPFDETLYLAPNLLSGADAELTKDSWTVTGYVNPTNPGLFLGNGIYRYSKASGATVFSCSKTVALSSPHNLPYLTDRIVFSVVVSSPNGSESHPFMSSNTNTLTITRGSSQNNIAGEVVWKKDEYLFGSYWRLAACVRLPRSLAPTDYKDTFTFSFSGLWADIGTIVYVAAPFVYEGDELYAYPPGLTLTGDTVLDKNGYHITSPSTNTLPETPVKINGTLTYQSFRYLNNSVYLLQPIPANTGPGGGLVSWLSFTPLTLQSGETATVSLWVKLTGDAGPSLPLLDVRGQDDAVLADITLSSQSYLDDSEAQLASTPNFNTEGWVRIYRTITASAPSTIYKVLFGHTSFTSGSCLIAGAQLEAGELTKFIKEGSTRTTLAGLSMPFEFASPCSITFRFKSLKTSSVSGTLIQIGSTFSLQVTNDALFYVAGENTIDLNYTVSTATWAKENVFTVVMPDSVTAHLYLNSLKITTDETAVISEITSIGNISINPGALRGSYRKLTVLPRVLAEDEIGNVAISFKKRLDTLKSKTVNEGIINKNIKEAPNLLISNYTVDPLYSTGVLNTMFTKAERANCKVVLSRSSSGTGKYSYTIQRTVNVPGSAFNTTMWGGIIIELPETAKLVGHTYKLRYKYKGISTGKGTIYLANNVSLYSDGKTLPPNPLSGFIPDNTNTKKWLSAETTYTVVDRDASKQLFIGWPVANTGVSGTQIFIDDIQIFDTEGLSFSGFQIDETGVKTIQTVPYTSSIYLSARSDAIEIPVAQWDDQSLGTLASARGLTLLIWDEDQIYNPATSPSISTYDVYGSDTARTNLANALLSIAPDKYWAVVSCQACGTNTALTSAFNSLGAYQYGSTVWGATSPNGAYVAFGYGQSCIKEDRRPATGTDKWYATIWMKIF